jgi:asparagine synthase (glutamine-hydrolysing)
MCGIFALLNNSTTFNGKFIYKNFMKGSGRGPEYSEYLNLYKNVDLGFHRLAINGLDSISNQPFRIQDITLICNGEIYNFNELYEEHNITPITNSDCEVIIHLYKLYGIEYTLSLLDGYYSFILVDSSDISKEPEIYVARDPYGVRPLYVMKVDYQNQIDSSILDTNTENVNDELIVFASELKMMNEFLKKQSNGNKIVYKQSFFNNKNNSAFNFDIKQYPPGTYSKLIRRNTIDGTFYFDLFAKKFYNFPLLSLGKELNKIYATENDQSKSYSTECMNEYFIKIYNAFDNAVKKRVIGTTERPIACLLSGGLDSSLVAALVSKYYGKQLETYSIGLPGGEDFKYARLVAEHIGSKHTEIVVSEEDFFNAIPEVIKNIESYDTTTVRASVGNYLVSKYISENSNAKVVFNGDGSDEVTGGYLYFHASPNGYEFDKEVKRLISDIYLFDVLRSDKSISSNGLEPRTPFLDIQFVNTYLSVPLMYRYNPGKPEKWLLRSSVETCDPEILPKTVLWRTKEAFSDGVSSQSRSWFEIIHEKVEDCKYKLNHYENEEHLKPLSLEQKYYRTLFDTYYPHCSKVLPYFWMPRFVSAKDASARTLKLYKEENTNVVNDK